MLNIESFFIALKASWLKKINDNPDSNWGALGRFSLEKITPTLDIISKMNFGKAEMLPDLKKLTKFYQDVVISYAKCNKKKLSLEKKDILEECLRGNCHMTVYSEEKKRHNVLNMKEWQLCDINVIKDLKINNVIIDEKYIFDQPK